MAKPRRDPPAMSRGSTTGTFPNESNTCDSIVKALCVAAGQNVTIEDAASKYLKSQIQTLMETGSISSGVDLSDLEFLNDEIKKKDFQSSIQDLFAGFDVCFGEHDAPTISEDPAPISKDCLQSTAASSAAKFMPQKPVRRPSVHPSRRCASGSEPPSNHGDALLQQILHVVTALERLDRAEKEARLPRSTTITSLPKTSSGEGQEYTNTTRHANLDAGSPCRTPKSNTCSRRVRLGNEESPTRRHSHAQPAPSISTVGSPRKKMLAREKISDPSPARNRGSHRSQLKGSRSASSRDLAGSSLSTRKIDSQSSKCHGTDQTRPRCPEGSTPISPAKARRRRTPDSNKGRKTTSVNTSHTRTTETREKNPVEFDFEQEESHNSSSIPRRGRGVSSSVPRRGRSRSVVRARSRSVSLSSRNLSSDLTSESTCSPRSHRSFFLLDPYVPEPLSKPRPPSSSGSSRRKHDGGKDQKERLVQSTLSSSNLLSSSRRGSSMYGGSGESARTAPAAPCGHYERSTASALAAAEFYDRTCGSEAFPTRHFSRRPSKDANDVHHDLGGTATARPTALQAFPSFDESDPLFSFDDSFSAFLSSNRHHR